MDLRRGSSPLTRGKRQAFRSFHHCRGLIPTHAGKTPTRTSRTPPPTAHPHSRGENGTRRCSALASRGSSPLTRGKLWVRPTSKLRRRLIPTHAGKTSGLPLVFLGLGAHPHSRGENESVAYGIPPMLGSSPLTRGKLGRFSGEGIASGLIPTHAGKTWMRPTTASCAAAHPHSRGENPLCGEPDLRLAGSSPLTRGKRRRVRHDRGASGLIPTHAGKTRHAAAADQCWRAHPHSRGENAITACRSAWSEGSSPLTRGKLG